MRLIRPFLFTLFGESLHYYCIRFAGINVSVSCEELANYFDPSVEAFK